MREISAKEKRKYDGKEEKLAGGIIWKTRLIGCYTVWYTMELLKD